jgi:lipoprotein NlpD
MMNELMTRSMAQKDTAHSFDTQLLFKKSHANHCLSISVALTTLCLISCSPTKPAPINDRSSNTTTTTTAPAPKKPTPAVTTSAVPNWSVTNEPTPKPKPVEQRPVNSNSVESKIEAKPDAKVESKQDSLVPDVSFKIAKPSNAPRIAEFNGGTSKGIDFGGQLGDPVKAVADGKVIFSGNSLRTYGNLVIVKHNNSYITVYANNKSLLVKEGDLVQKGQKIAEMGNSETDRVKLHFELRRDSKPIDPTNYFE